MKESPPPPASAPVLPVTHTPRRRDASQAHGRASFSDRRTDELVRTMEGDRETYFFCLAFFAEAFPPREEMRTRSDLESAAKPRFLVFAVLDLAGY